MSAASSRAFRLHGEIPMLLPLVDMCNHSFSPNARIVQVGDVDSPDMSVKASVVQPCTSKLLLLLPYIAGACSSISHHVPYLHIPFTNVEAIS
jgi:hypothetical protein